MFLITTNRRRRVIKKQNQISCAGATESATIGYCTGGGILKYYVNGEEIGSGYGRDVYDGQLEADGLRITPISDDGSVNTDAPYYDGTVRQKFENTTNALIKVKVETIDASVLDTQHDPFNPTVVFRNSMGVSTAEFCLLPLACEPQGLTIPAIVLGAGEYEVNIDTDDASFTVSYTSTNPNMTAVGLFNQLLQIGQAQDFFVAGAGGTNYFQMQHWTGNIEAAAGDGSHQCDLWFSGDVINQLFGQPAINIHACGTQYWEGV